MLVPLNGRSSSFLSHAQVQVISFNVSIFTLTAISIDRHRAITQPLASKLTKFKANVIIILIWCFSLLLAVPTFLSWDIRYITKEMDTQIDYSELVNDQSRVALNAWSQSGQNQSLHASPNIHSPSPSDLENAARSGQLAANMTEPFCDLSTNVISDRLRKYYHQFLVCVQFFIPLFVISFMYIHIAIKLNSEDLSTNARSDYQRALQVKKRVSASLLPSSDRIASIFYFLDRLGHLCLSCVIIIILKFCYKYPFAWAIAPSPTMSGNQALPSTTLVWAAIVRESN